MTQYQIAIVALLIAQALTLALLCSTYKKYTWFRRAWTRDAYELLQWKRYGLMRDPATGRYKRNGDY